MKIILTKDLPGLGFKDEVVSVKNGYGRNYIIPQGFGVLANKSNSKVLKENLKQTAKKQEEILNKSVKDADRLNALVENILLATKIDDNGLPLNPEELDLSSMMEKVTLDMLESSGKTVNVEFFIQPSVYFNGDKDAFYSILINFY